MEPTQENVEAYQKAIIKLVQTADKVEGTYRNGKSGEFQGIHFIDHKTKLWAVFKNQTKGAPHFITGWRLSDSQYNDLIKNQNV